MVELQDALNVALFVSVVLNIVQIVYGPWAKRRGELRQLRAKLAEEIRGAKIAAGGPRMGGYVGRLESWREYGDRFPRSVRREVRPFYELTESYLDAYLRATKLVKLAVYESVAARTDLAPVLPQRSGEEEHWIVNVDGSLHSRDNLEDSLIEVLTEPLLRGDHVRWSWIKDHQERFAAQLLRVTDETTANRLLEDIEKRLSFEQTDVERPRQIKERIREYPLPHFPPPK
jgi:hypothetical protein